VDVEDDRVSLTGHDDGSTPDLCVLLTTTSTEDEARALASGLLKAGLAACVQLSQVDSLYVWDGAVAEDPEVRLMIKTRRTSAAAVAAWLEREHPYEVPQIVVLPAMAVGSEYLDWLIEVTSDPSSDPS